MPTTDPSSPDTDPQLAVSTDHIKKPEIGRLYRYPGSEPIDSPTLDEVKAKLKDGTLVPSTTNVIGVRNKPHLMSWAAWLAAKEAVDMVRTNKRILDRIHSNPFGAIEHFKNTAERQTVAAGKRGTNVHYACELLSLGKTINHLELTADEQACVDAFKEWLDIFQPEFIHAEVTGFGTTESGLSFGQTADFIANVQGVTMLGDYKCTTLDTPILLSNGTQKMAGDIEVGDRVVAWTKEKGLHPASISYAGDNGVHDVLKVTTVTGHSVATTHNHPFYTSRNSQGLAWKKADELAVGDEVYIAAGWNYAPGRGSIDWPYDKWFSPYHFGLLWALAQYSEEPWDINTKALLPKASRQSLRDELGASSFKFTKKDELIIKKGLQKITGKNKFPDEELLELLNEPTLPVYVTAGTKETIAAFFAGVREVFKSDLWNGETFIRFRDRRALEVLQQLILNYGQPADIDMSRDGHEFLRTPHENSDLIYTHGLTAVKISKIEMLPAEPTVAIEVEGSHTHITGGILTHNTNKKGLYSDVALQLAANERSTILTADGETTIEPTSIDMSVGLHLSPKGWSMQHVNTSEEVFRIYSLLRELWDYHVFETTPSGEQMLLDKIRTVEQLRAKMKPES